jgi:acyl-coenzyme A synthetase/AMP-(fatty) acid ligase
LETILPLLSGLQVIMASEADQKDPTALASLITRQKVDLLQVTPSHLKLLLAAGNEPRMLQQLQVIMVGGEAFPADLLQELQQAFRGRIYNMYGPTETTVWSAIQELTGAAAVTIGGPIANTTLRIVDRYNNLQPIGLTGELCIGGDGLTRGYWKNALLTGEKIIPDPVNPNEKLYRTGDLVKWLPDGSIEFVGRADYQVKLRGFRIELGEIESQLMTYNGISQATVVKRENEGDEFLVGYYVAECEIEMTGIRNYLLGKLPDYMVPAYFVHLASMPLTPNGKINRKALPAPQKISGVGFIPPANEWEQELAAIWQEVLQVESIGTNVDFFVAGGNSLKLIQLFKGIDARYPKCIKVMDLFSNRTIAGLAALLKNRLHAGKRSEKKQTTILDF